MKNELYKIEFSNEAEADFDNSYEYYAIVSFELNIPLRNFAILFFCVTFFAKNFALLCVTLAQLCDTFFCVTLRKTLRNFAILFFA